MEKVIIVFELKNGQTKEDLVDTLKTLTFEDGMSHLEELVESIDDGDTVHRNV